MNLERLSNKRSKLSEYLERWKTEGNWGKIISPISFPLNLLIIILLSLIACGTPYVKQIDGIPYEYDKHKVWVPLWIRFPQSLCQNEIAAVGVYGPTLYPEYGREKAIENGRNELSRSFSVRVQNIVKSWPIDHENYFTGAASSQKFREEISRQTTDVELTGAVVKQFWVHPVTKMNYALVAVSLNQAQQQAISTVRRIGSEQKRLFVRKRVNEAFKELDQILRKMKSKDF